MPFWGGDSATRLHGTCGPGALPRAGRAGAPHLPARANNSSLRKIGRGQLWDMWPASCGPPGNVSACHPERGAGELFPPRVEGPCVSLLSRRRPPHQGVIPRPFRAEGPRVRRRRPFWGGGKYHPCKRSAPKSGGMKQAQGVSPGLVAQIKRQISLEKLRWETTPALPALPSVLCGTRPRTPPPPAGRSRCPRLSG